MNDNLLDQKTETNVRHQIRASVRSNFNRWRSAVNVQILDMNNNAAVDTLGYTYTNTVLSTHQALVFGPDTRVRQLGLQYNYQQSDKNMHRSESRSMYHTLNLTGSMKVVERLLLNMSTGLSFRNTPEQGNYTSQVYSLRLSHTAFQNRLNTTLFSSSSMIRDSRMLRLGLNAGYRLTRRNLIRFNLTYNIFRGTREFEEFRTSLNLSHRL
ncbi:MAG TPA: hypothetical protein ENN03_10585 [bacterium]|nr:hypothetical protein [bacterium]